MVDNKDENKDKPAVRKPEQVEGHTVTKFFNKLNGQPESYVNKSNYVFGKTLGAGTFGVVRQARYSPTNDDVAVKILLKKALKGNDVQLQMLYDELSILQMLKHPNIVEFKDWFESKDKFYIVTQLAVGGELFDRILAKGKFTERDAVSITMQILSAVDYMHSKNVVHRDLKPENVLYIDKSDDSQLVIADFGIAKQLQDNDDLIFKAAGSLGYVAPEVLTNNGHGKPCDIWSIGVIVYTLLCGYSAFVAETVDGFLEECTQNKYPVTFHKPYWDNISDEAKNFILRALTLDPAERPTAAELMKDPWITNTRPETANIYPEIRKGFDLRKKLRDAIEIVKLNNRIKKLRSLYMVETDTDIEENVASVAFNTLASSLNDLRLHSQKRVGQLTAEQRRLKSALTQDTFAQIVRAATKNKERIWGEKTASPTPSQSSTSSTSTNKK
ncbi:Serine/Threonine protein kinases active-site signature [Nakaseomyces glabratus]|nr:Serine/Threonine protein kinases active-site signature [Nakaseomyces glabratus]KAH7594651.1 Serine/Threonine protein kinases active-site signature [Nakaseomyces glabratus]